MTTSHPQTPAAAPTAQGPDELRDEIARTRADMDATLAQLEDRVSPSRIKERQTEKVRSRWRSAKDAVMGSAEDAKRSVAGSAQDGSNTVGDAASNAQDAVAQAPDRVEQATRGNPLAAGLIAAGVGALVGSLLPATRQEQELASELRDTFEQPVRDQLQQAGQDVAGELQDHAQQAVEDVKQTAQGAAQTTQQEAKRSAEQVTDSAKDAKDTVQQQR